MELHERFNRKIDKGGNCWEWTAAKFASGYGAFNIKGKVWYAHRLAYTLANGEIPDGLFVCHSCDNRSCVNPEHLWLGTNTDNLRDASDKGRLKGKFSPQGERHSQAKLTADDVENIRANAMNLTQQEQAEIYGVGQSQINRIIKRESWAHI